MSRKGRLRGKFLKVTSIQLSANWPSSGRDILTACGELFNRTKNFALIRLIMKIRRKRFASFKINFAWRWHWSKYLLFYFVPFLVLVTELALLLRQWAIVATVRRFVYGGLLLWTSCLGTVRPGNARRNKRWWQWPPWPQAEQGGKVTGTNDEESFVAVNLVCNIQVRNKLPRGGL